MTKITHRFGQYPKLDPVAEERGRDYARRHGLADGTGDAGSQAIHDAVVRAYATRDQEAAADVAVGRDLIDAAVEWQKQGVRSKWTTGPSLRLWDAVSAYNDQLLRDAVREAGKIIDARGRKADS